MAKTRKPQSTKEITFKSEATTQTIHICNRRIQNTHPPLHPTPIIFLSAWWGPRGRDPQCPKHGTKSYSLEWDGCVKLKRGYKMQSLKEPAYKIAASEKKPTSGSDRVLRNMNHLPEKTSQSSPLNTYQKHQKHIKNTI